MIEVKDVSKKLGSFKLKNISFQLPKGYIMGLIGPNGAGKTSLLKLLLGLYRADDGEIIIDGMNYEQQERQIKEEIGFVLQSVEFFEYRSIRENAKVLGAHYENYEKAEFDRYCEEFELNQEAKAEKLSRGERMKFQFAFALAHHPKLLIFDEATGSFDPEFRAKMQKHMTDFVSDGEHSILFSSHVCEEMERIADYITMLQNGELVFSMDRETLLDSYRVITGEPYKLRLLRPERVIWKQENEFGARALVTHSQGSQYDREVTVTRPAVEDILYGFSETITKLVEFKSCIYNFDKLDIRGQ